MATVNKDFKIKSGLVVEGANGTIGGHNILTESTSGDQYILNLIGGETLVKSVGANLSVDGAGELSLDLVGIVEDIAGTRLTTDGSTINVDVDGIADDLTGSYDFATNSDVTFAVGQEATNRDSAIATAKSEAGVIAQGYADTAEENANSYTNTAITNLDLSNTYDAKGSAATAEQNAKNYADMKINDASNTTTEVWSAYKTSTEIGLAQAAAETHADEAIAALVGAAPLVLDTLEELATALENNPDIIADLENVAAGKQNTLTPGANIDISNDTISVTGLDSEDISDFNTAALSATASAYDAAGSASTAYANAEIYINGEISNEITNRNTAISDAISTEVTNRNTAITDAVNAIDTDDIEEGTTNLYFTDSRAKTSAADLLTGASLTNITITGTGAGLTITAENGVADSTTDDLVEGEENLYFNDERAIDAISNADIYPNAVIVDNVAKQVASQITAATAGIQIGHAFAKASYRSAEFLVKVAYGDHTEISKVLLTLDVNDNISITEYGVVGTNGSASTISADISGTDVRLLVTTANNNSTVTVMGTLLI